MVGALLLMLVVGATAVTVARRRGRPTPFPAIFAPLLHSRLRRVALRPSDVTDCLDLAPGQQILEIGPGSGYVTREVEAHLAPAGLLIGLDIQWEMLRVLRSRTVSCVLVCASGSELPFRDGSFDRVFLVSVLGEIPDQAAALCEYYRVLRPGGLLVVTEALYDPDFVRAGTLASLAERARFALGDRSGNRLQYTQRFRRE